MGPEGSLKNTQVTLTFLFFSSHQASLKSFIICVVPCDACNEFYHPWSLSCLILPWHFIFWCQGHGILSCCIWSFAELCPCHWWWLTAFFRMRELCPVVASSFVQEWYPSDVLSVAVCFRNGFLGNWVSDSLIGIQLNASWFSFFSWSQIAHQFSSFYTPWFPY